MTQEQSQSADSKKITDLPNKSLIETLKEVITHLHSDTLTETLKGYPEFGINTLSIDLMADCPEPIQAKAYEFTDLKVCIDDFEPNRVFLQMQTSAGLQAQAIFSKESGELVYTGLQVLNNQKKPAAWEKPTSPVAEIRIIEASTVALKQLQG